MFQRFFLCPKPVGCALETNSIGISVLAQIELFETLISEEHKFFVCGTRMCIYQQSDTK